MDFKDKIDNEDETNGVSLCSPPDISLPSKPAINEKVLDDELWNLKQAYNVSLEWQDGLGYHGYEECVTNDNGNEEEDEEEGLVDGHHPMEFCESQIVEEEDGNSSQSSGYEYRCCYCNFKGTIPVVRNHTKFVHPGEHVKTYWCNDCGLNFRTEVVYCQHQTQEHRFFCPHCNKRFIREIYLVAHLTNHNEDKSFKCPICGKTYISERLLAYHLGTHERRSEGNWVRSTNPKRVEVKQYKCTVCKKDFAKKESVIKHTKIHSRELIKCSQCDFTCMKKITLKMHRICHEGNRKYKCNSCDYSFKQIGHLKRHVARFNH